MKLKFLLLFLMVVGFSAWMNAQTKPYKYLIITESRNSEASQNYIEFTNMGTETVDLSEFEFGEIGNGNTPWIPAEGYHFMLPKKNLAPGKSFLIAMGSDFEPENWKKDPLHNAERVTKPEFYKLADMILHRREINTNANDSITPNWATMDCYKGRECWFLRHHFLDAEGKKDSMVIDQVSGIFDGANGRSQDKSHDVAGVTNATYNSVLIRKTAVKTGISEFSSQAANTEAAKLQFGQNRGLDLKDSEWIPVPILGLNKNEPWRAVFWTAGNQVDAKLDANTLVSKTGKVKVDLDMATITVPWGVRNDDSLMYQFVRKPGLAWKYDYAPNVEDSAYVSARTGDKLTLFVCGNEATIKEFKIIVNEPTASDNIVIPKNFFDYTRNIYGQWASPYSGIRVTEGVKNMDTISYIDYATRVDTLFKYLEKAPKASWKIIYKDGLEKPDLKNGDLLRVSSENGKVKDYFLKVEKFVPSPNNKLASITWPDIPAYFKGDVATSYGWKGDTIPGFSPSKNDYLIKIPLEFQGIPALMFTKDQTDSKVIVSRAKTLDGSLADRTVTFTVTAEDDSTQNVYTVRFEKEKDMVNTQPWKGEPFFSQYVFWESWWNCYLEIYNPGTEPLDLSNYMIAMGWGNSESVLKANTSATSWSKAYSRYVPGKKWVNEPSWQVQPAILEPDLATNSIVYPGDVFVIAQIRVTSFNDKTHGNGDTEYRKEIDIDFAKNPWGRKVHDDSAIGCWKNATIYMWKILNDSVKSGLKPATDSNDFELIETWGTGGASKDVLVGGKSLSQVSTIIRKPNIYKGNPIVGGSNGATYDDSEWSFRNQAYFQNLKYGWPEYVLRMADGIGSHNMNEVTIYRSTVASTVYKVSPGYSKNETIEGIKTGTIVSGFYANINKADPNQSLTVKSGNKVLVDADAITKGDSLIVLSADSTNISKYILDVTANGLSSNAILTSTKFTVDVNGTTGTIGGIKQRELLKNVLANVVVPTGAKLTITDANDAYMSLTKLNYDTSYVNVIATDKVFFEVIAENGTSKVLYQLKPTVNPSDAYITSDVYSVDQFAFLIQFIPNGTSVSALLNNVYPSAGAKVVIYDKAGFLRENGDIYKDDKLIVTSSDGKVTKAYYFSMLNFNVNSYLAYVISDDYTVDQVARTISNNPTTKTTLAEFKAKLYTSFGATLMVTDKNGVESTLGDLSQGDKLKVTAADGKTIAVYDINVDVTGIAPITENIKMYPNPTSDRIVINGLTAGNRVQVFNAVGVTLRDVIVENSTEYVSLSAQPKGIYVFVISSGGKHINIQTIIKQ